MPDFESLAGKLHSSDAEERREASIDLGRAGRPAVPFLFHALADSDWRVRKTAVEALVALADRAVIAGLVQALSSHDNAGARNSAIEALVHIGADAVDALLTPLPGIRDPDVRKFIVDILGDIGDSRGVPALIAILSDPEENVRVAAAEALGKIKDRRAVDPLLACLSCRDQGWLDYAAAEALGEIGDERALGPLMAALERSSLREPVIESLGKIGNVHTLAPIISGLGDPLRIVREASLTALTAIYKKSTEAERKTIVRTVRKGATDRIVSVLEEMLTTGAGKLQKGAVVVLGWIGRESSIPKMLDLLQEEEMEEPVVQALAAGDAETELLLGYLASENALIRRTVAGTLGSRRRYEAENALIRLLMDENGHVRSTAAEALGQLKSRKAVPALLDLLTDEYESVQESGIRALAAIGDESVLDGLVRDFSTRDAPLRKNIASLLGQFSTAQAVDALSFALKDQEPFVRKAAVQALGNQTGECARRSLLLAVTDDEPEVRMIAAEALGREASMDAAEALILLLRDPDLWVRAAAARGLGRIGGERYASLLAVHLPDASDIFLLALIDVLGRLNAEQALKPFLKLAAHADPEVRKSVLASLSGYPWDSVRETAVSLLSDAHWSVRKAAIEIVRQKQDADSITVLERMADQDPDAAVRQAAKEALKNNV